MAIIGVFTKTEDGGFIGTIRTMTINVKTKILPNPDKTSEAAPDYRVFAGGAELGAGWRQSTKEGERDYVSVRLDDPNFSAAIRAAFFENVEEGTGVLVWTRT